MQYNAVYYLVKNMNFAGQNNWVLRSIGRGMC